MKIVFACGGTGGHIFPGIALAEVFQAKAPKVEIVFAGTPRGLEQKILAKFHWRLEMLTAVSFADKKGWKKIPALWTLVRSLGQARRFLQKEKPAGVIGVGGYAAVPLLLAAVWLHLPTLTLEPNAIPGLANRLLKFFVERVVVAYPDMEKHFGNKALLLGVPIRRDLLEQAKPARPVSPRKTVLIFGGSQGALRLNEAVFEALPHLADLKEKIDFIHQIGWQEDLRETEQRYQRLGFNARVYGFIEAMGPRYAESDWVIARSGANTIAELLAVRKPSLLIPYPFAQGGHQEANARWVEQLGGAVVLPEAGLDGETLAHAIRQMVEEEGRLEAMQKNLARLKRENAAERIADYFLQRVGYV